MDAWNKLGEYIYEKLLKACALNLKVDGQENFCINCFKQDELYAAGYEKLQRQLYVLKDSIFNVNSFSKSDVEEAAREINSLNASVALI